MAPLPQLHHRDEQNQVLYISCSGSHVQRSNGHAPSGTHLLRSRKGYLEAYETGQLSCRRQSPRLISKAVCGLDTEAEQEECGAAAVAHDSPEKTDSFVALNWEGKRENKEMSCLVFC